MTGNLRLYEMQKLNFAELFISLEGYYQYEGKISPTKSSNEHKYTECI